MKKIWQFRSLFVCVAIAACIFTYVVVVDILRNAQAPVGMIGESINEVLDAPAGDGVEGSTADIPDVRPPIAAARPDTSPDLREHSLKVIDLVNAERVKAGVVALAENDLLYKAASVRAEELEELFSHYRPNGSLCFTVFGDFEIVGRARAENIAASFISPEDVVDAWMNSEGHCRNILNPAYSNIGVGVHLDPSGKLHWVQLFSG